MARKSLTKKGYKVKSFNKRPPAQAHKRRAKTLGGSTRGPYKNRKKYDVYTKF